MACSKDNGFLVVAAIDFGTTYSGYAFSFRDQPMQIHSPQTWYAGSTTLASLKTPTCLLLKADKSFDSFGYEAENKYAALAGDGVHKEYYFFERFKMTLHGNKTLSRKSQIDDIRGRSLPALLVFSKSIEFFKNHIMKTLTDRTSTLVIDDVKFVLTVPAIWTDSAKQFMREAAVNAGIDTDHLVLALEPEAASMYCKDLPVEKTKGGQGLKESAEGSQYLIADIGGGTADFCVHERASGEKLIEKHKATGGAYGGIFVDKQFENLLKRVFGPSALKKLKNSEIIDYIDIFREFEFKKRTVKTEFSGKYIIRIPAALTNIARDLNANFVEEIEKTKIKGQVKLHGDKMKIDATLMKSLFDESLKSITRHIDKILKKFPKIKQILLVGGYGECCMLQTLCRDMFGEKELIIPNECGLAVVNGAVLYGYRPETIATRIMKYTYCVNNNMHFIPGRHPEDRKYTNDDGVEKCRGSADIIIPKGKPVSSDGETIIRKVLPFNRQTTRLHTTVYYTEVKHPTLCDECTELGNVVLNLPKYDGRKRICEERFTFGKTEIEVRVTFLETLDSIGGKFDLLE